MPHVDVDLSTVAVNAPKTVRLTPDGPVYRLPGDIPAPLYLKLRSYDGREDDLDDDQAVGEIYAELLSLFKLFQPELETLPLSIPQLLAAIPLIYGGATVEDVRPPQPATPATQTTKKTGAKRTPAKRTRSRT